MCDCMYNWFVVNLLELIEIMYKWFVANLLEVNEITYKKTMPSAGLLCVCLHASVYVH